MSFLVVLMIGAGYYLNYRSGKSAEQKQAALQQAFRDARVTELKTGGPVFESENETYQRAVATYDSLIEKYPQFAQAFDWRGNAFSGLGQYERALQDYEKAIELTAENTEAQNNLRAIYQNHVGAVNRLMADRGQTANYDAAISAYTQAINSNPKLTEAYFGRAETYRTLGDKGNKASYDLAIADYSRIISQLNRGTAEVYFKRGLSYKAKGDSNNALADLQKALELPGDDVLRENVKNNLQEVKANPPAPLKAGPPRIFIEYNDPDDEDVVDQIASDLSQNYHYRVVGTPQVSAGKTNGDVRCFNTIDFDNAKRIAQIVQDGLSQRGHVRTIEARLPFGGYPNVPLGTIEIWIPSLQIAPGSANTTPTALCRDGTLVSYVGSSPCLRHGGVASLVH
jgi:tetratricopeptide (TPR) repeat protein